MNPKKILFVSLTSIIAGLLIAIIATAFNNPTGNPPTGTGAIIGIGSNAPASSLYIDSAGKVGIGTAVPGYKLDVQGGQINTSGGLCIAGVCKTDWNQVQGTNYWTLSGSDLYPNQTSYRMGVGTVSPDANYKITTVGGGIKAVSNIASQPAGYFDNPSGYSLITGSGNVGIGKTPGGYALDVNGNVNATAYYGSGANLTGIAGGIPSSKVYDSGWFAVSANTAYTKTHNLGTTKLLVLVYVSQNSDGSGWTAIMNNGYFGSAGDHGGIFTYAISTTNISLRTANSYLYIGYNAAGGGAAAISFPGYSRVVILALE